MNREEKLKTMIDKGFTYNPETGRIYGNTGREIVRKNKKGYIEVAFRHNKSVYSVRGHQFSWYFIHKQIVEQIDHINGIKDDNRICNLRPVNNAKNQWNINRKGYNKLTNRNLYISRISINGKRITLGLYKTEDEARNAYLEAKEKYHRL